MTEQGTGEREVNKAMMNDVTAEFVRWTKDDAIAVLVEIARDTSSSAVRKDAPKHILLLVGAIDGFKDSEGDWNRSPRGFVMEHPDSPDAPAVRSMIAAKGLIEDAARRTKK